MPPTPVDRRAVLSGLGAGAVVATVGLGGSRAHAAAQTWLWIDAPAAWPGALQTAHALGLDAVTVDGSGLSSGEFASLLERVIPVARQAGLDVHAGLGDLGERRPGPDGAASDHDHPAFAKTPHHRLFDPVAEALRDHVEALLAIPDLAGLQLAALSNNTNRLGGLIGGHVIAPARLRGKVLTVRIASAPIPSAWALDAVFRPLTPSPAGYGLLRQSLS